MRLHSVLSSCHFSHVPFVTLARRHFARQLQHSFIEHFCGRNVLQPFMWIFGPKCINKIYVVSNSGSTTVQTAGCGIRKRPNFGNVDILPKSLSLYL